eukprot:7066143-Heterocapsa_arctica.AAC.1
MGLCVIGRPGGKSAGVMSSVVHVQPIGLLRLQRPLQIMMCMSLVHPASQFAGLGYLQKDIA